MPGILSSIQPSKKLQMLVAALLFAGAAIAQDPSKVPDAMANPLAQFLVFIMILLAVAIGVLAHVVNGAASIYRDKLRKEKETSKNNAPVAGVVMLPLFLFASMRATAQDVTATPAAAETINGLSMGTFYAMIAVLCVEILIIVVLIFQLKWLLGIGAKKEVKAVAAPAVPKVSWWERLNKSIAIEKEKDIDLNHDYDGIRELDNSIPPWWTVAFILTILFGVGYVWRYHVAQSAPLQIEEYKLAMEKAEIETAAYLAKTASLVDENSIKMLDDAGVALGQSLFSQNCSPCHGPEGQGAAVGPNLSDKYWLHGGSIHDIFKTIKYGWPDKGMRSWQEDMSPVQIAQLSSYVMSLQGTNPANPKEPQGELFSEDAAPDASSVTDSTTLKAPDGK